jgi:hypothetical protein
MTMLLTNVRTKPWRARESRSSLSRVTVMLLSACVIETPTGKSRVSVPFGPLIVTDKPEILTSTPEGTTTASFPIRDMMFTLS